MEDATSMSTLMTTSTKLDSDEKGKSVDIKLYRSMIGSLLYLAISRLDIMFVFACVQDSNLILKNRIWLLWTFFFFHHLKHTPNLGLWYSKDTYFNLINYTDADYAGSRVDKKSLSGSCQLLSNMIVSWCYKKQNSVALSTIEAEYVATGSCCAQVLWMKQ